MAAFTTIIAAAALATAATGTYMQYQGQKKQAAYQQQILAEQQQQEALRQQQMNLDATRRKREIVRAQIAARSAALATATSQGASGAGSSSLEGAYGGISGRSNVNYLGVNQNQEIGNSLFASNARINTFQQGSARAGSMISMGSGLSSLGNALMKAEGSFNRVGTYLSKSFAVGPSASAIKAASYGTGGLY